MENNQYIPLGTNHAWDDNLIALIEAYGMAGYGIYIALLFELRKRADYLCALRSIPALARGWEVSTEQLEHIIYDFGLFGFTSRAAAEGVETAGEADCFCSPYLFQVMDPLVQKRVQCTVAGKVRAFTAERATDGRFTSASQRVDQPIEKSRVKESRVEEEKKSIAEEKRAEESLGTADSGPGRWELLLLEAFNDESWVEVQAMHSGMQQRFGERLAEILDFFKTHVRTYGKEATILSVADVKNYFSNFIRRGSPTRKSLDAHLSRRQSADKQRDPYRFEQRDLLTGERTYCGRPIPADAPPRPHENAVWSGEEWG